MRYIKVLLAIVFFYFVMLFFVQNQEALSQSTTLKLDLMFIPPMESLPLSYYMLALICFLVGGLCTLVMLIWDRLSISAHLGSANRRVRALEKELAKSTETLDTVKKELEQASARATDAEARAALAEANKGAVLSVADAHM